MLAILKAHCIAFGWPKKLGIVSFCTFTTTFRSSKHSPFICPLPFPKYEYSQQRRVKFTAISRSPQMLFSASKGSTLALKVATGSVQGFAAFIIPIALCGLVAEKTPVGAALSAPLVTMGISLLFCNIGLLPTESVIYNFVNKYLVAMAVPLLLFEADLRRVLRETGRMLWAFLVAAFGTVVGTIVAWIFVPLQRAMGSDGWKIASALTARHIGGAVNYIAATEQLEASRSAVLSGVAADNVSVAVFFLMLFALARNVRYKPIRSTVGGKAIPEEPTPPALSSGNHTGIPRVQSFMALLQNIVIAVSISAALCGAGTWLSNIIPNPFGPIPVTTLLVVSVATLFPQMLRPYRVAARTVGIIFMQLFFAVTGASGSITTVIKTAPILFAFSAVQLVSHLVVLLILGRALLRIPMEELLLASNSSVGGPSTSAGMAVSKRWDGLLIPAILVGVFGYSIATFLSITMGQFMLRHWR